MISLLDLFTTVNSESILLVDKISENKEEFHYEEERFDLLKLKMIKDAIHEFGYPMNFCKIDLSVLSNDAINCTF
jgi:hypothetical protein